MSQWYYAANGAQQGPVTQDQLIEWVRNGQFPADTLVWKDGMAQWLPASQVTELAGAFGGGGGDAGGQPAYGVSPEAQQQAYGAAAQYGTAAYGAAQAAPLGYAQPSSAYGPPGYQYSGFWWRVLASIIDGIILQVIQLVVGFAIGLVIGLALAGGGGRGNGAAAVAQLVASLTGIVIQWLYDAFQESSVHQATLGKRVCGIVVTDLNGQRLTFARATGRHFGKYLSALICGIGFIMVAFTEKKQGLHDQMANTLVWKKP